MNLVNQNNFLHGKRVQRVIYVLYLKPYFLFSIISILSTIKYLSKNSLNSAELKLQTVELLTDGEVDAASYVRA